jgi:hypothetical protein
MNFYDGVPYAKNPTTGIGEPIPGATENYLDVDDAVEALKIFRDAGLQLVNVTAGCPYFNPHVGRPADKEPPDGYGAPENNSSASRATSGLPTPLGVPAPISPSSERDTVTCGSTPLRREKRTSAMIASQSLAWAAARSHIRISRVMCTWTKERCASQSAIAPP